MTGTATEAIGRTKAGWKVGSAHPALALRTSWPAVVVAAAGFASAVWAATLLVRRTSGLAAPPYDLAFFQQVIWNVGQSGLWVSSFHDGSFLGLHFSPALVVPALIERLVGPDVRVLNVLDGVAVGALAPAAFLFLRGSLRPSRLAGPLAAGVAVGIPLWGTSQDLIRSDFHPETAGVVLALLAGWAGLVGRPAAMWLLAVAAMATREDVAYAVFVAGLVEAARSRGPVRRHGGALALVAVAWAAVVFGLVMPWIRAGVGVQTDGYYAWLGGPVGLLTAPFTRPAEILNALDRPAPWFVVAGLVVGVLGLPLVRPRWLILVAPPLAALLLSAHSFQAGLRLQYPLILVTPLLAATAFGGRRVLAVLERGRRRWRRRRRQASVSAAWPGRPGLPRRAGFAVGLVFALAAAPGLSDAWVQGSIPPFDDGDPAFVDRPSSIDRLWTVGAAVPRDASLVADEGLLAPLAGRTSIGRLVGPPDPEAFVLLDRQAWFPTGLARTRHERAMKALPASGRPLLADDGRFVLYGPVGGSSP